MGKIFIDKTSHRFGRGAFNRVSPRFGTQAFCAVSMGVIALVLYSGTVAAGTATGAFQVSGKLVKGCTISGYTLSFGSLNPTTIALPVNRSTISSVTCTKSTFWTMGLDVGQNAATPGDYSTRRMKNGPNYLPYQLYWNSGYSVASTESGSGLLTATGTGAAQPFGVYGQIQLADLTSAVPGAYADTVTVTLTY